MDGVHVTPPSPDVDHTRDPLKLIKAKGGGGAAPVAVDKGDLIANVAAWGHYEGAENWRHATYDHTQGCLENKKTATLPVGEYEGRKYVD